MTNTSERYDVAIVGAGPAGASAAWHLANEGLKVVILEKNPWPREKTCGGGVVSRALRELPEGFAIPAQRLCHKASINICDASLSFTASRKKPIVTMVMRAEFDQALINAAISAGAHFRDNAAVASVQGNSREMALIAGSCTLYADMVILADGVNSKLAPQIGFPDNRLLAPAIEWELPINQNEMDQFEDIARFDFGIIDDGYAWAFPKKNHLSVGLGTMRARSRNLPGTLRAYLDDLGLSDQPAISSKGHLIPLSPRCANLAIGRALLIGDAAGFVDPVTAEGITFALQSGRLAAESIVAGQIDPARVPHIYQETLRKTLLREIRCGRYLATLLYRMPKVRNRIFQKHGQRLAERMADLVMGETSYADVLRKSSFWFRILGVR